MSHPLTSVPSATAIACAGDALGERVAGEDWVVRIDGRRLAHRGSAQPGDPGQLSLSGWVGGQEGRRLRVVESEPEGRPVRTIGEGLLWHGATLGVECGVVGETDGPYHWTSGGGDARWYWAPEYSIPRPRFAERVASLWASFDAVVEHFEEIVVGPVMDVDEEEWLAELG